MEREDFMNFLRNDEKLNLSIADDRMEVFSSILIGNPDISKELLNDLLIDYSVNSLIVKEVTNELMD